jgi:superfamily II helicase
MASFKIYKSVTIFNHYWYSALAIVGIGIHHAGLSPDDRRAIEDLFHETVLKAVITTSVSFPILSCVVYKKITS